MDLLIPASLLTHSTLSEQSIESSSVVRSANIEEMSSITSVADLLGALVGVRSRFLEELEESGVEAASGGGGGKESSWLSLVSSLSYSANASWGTVLSLIVPSLSFANGMLWSLHTSSQTTGTSPDTEEVNEATESRHGLSGLTVAVGLGSVPELETSWQLNIWSSLSRGLVSVPVVPPLPA